MADPARLSRPRSLRLRLALAAGATLLIALGAAGVGLTTLFERHVERRVAAELRTYLDQLAAGVGYDADGALIDAIALADPRFEQVYGGLYWQILDEAAGARRRSRSLWDTALDLPDDKPPVGALHRHRLDGPAGAALLVFERRLIVTGGGGDHVIRLAVAIDRGEVDALTADFAEDLALALVSLGLLLTAAAMIQLQIGLRPLEATRRQIAAIRSGRAARLDAPAPAEIAPLVEEVNALLEAQERSIRQARDRAADLAHGFKTPLTSLISDARRLRAIGQDEIAEDVQTTARIMRRQIERELTRARRRELKSLAPVDPHPILDGLVRTLKRTPEGEAKAIEIAVADGAAALVEPEDLADILGALMENAARHAESRVRVSGGAADGLLRFRVEDDGPGVPEERCAEIMGRGARLDRGGAGSGLGLAITRDVLEQYGQELRLGRSELGGLEATFALPAGKPDA